MMNLESLREYGWSPNSILQCFSVQTPSPKRPTTKKRPSIMSPQVRLTNSMSRVSKILKESPSKTLDDFTNEIIDLTISTPIKSKISLEDVDNKENIIINSNTNTNVHTNTARTLLLKHMDSLMSINPKNKFRSALTIHKDTTAATTIKNDPKTKETETDVVEIIPQRNDNISMKLRIIEAANLDLPLPNGWNLFAHQKDAIRQCIERERSILAYDMGLGKTVICLTWASAIAKIVPDCLVVVICPCTLSETWKRESEMIGFENIDLSSLKSKHLGLTHQRTKLLIVSWAKVPDIDELFASSNQTGKLLLIADEAHAMQSLASQRCQAALKLCHHVRCIGTILSTGTPMKNGRPCNLYPLLLAIRHPIARNKLEFEKRYCNARKTKQCPWDINGASNLTELKEKIGGFLLRKTKVREWQWLSWLILN